MNHYLDWSHISTPLVQIDVLTFTSRQYTFANLLAVASRDMIWTFEIFAIVTRSSLSQNMSRYSMFCKFPYPCRPFMHKCVCGLFFLRPCLIACRRRRLCNYVVTFGFGLSGHKLYLATAHASECEITCSGHRIF